VDQGDERRPLRSSLIGAATISVSSGIDYLNHDAAGFVPAAFMIWCTRRCGRLPLSPVCKAGLIALDFDRYAVGEIENDLAGASGGGVRGQADQVNRRLSTLPCRGLAGPAASKKRGPPVFMPGTLVDPVFDLSSEASDLSCQRPETGSVPFAT
jgi:hypothetical protein